jgi:dihydroxyacid dehydratase/phosphogluconate dehydratase
MTVTGQTLGENLERWTHEHGELSSDQDVIRPLERPIKETGHIRSVPDERSSRTILLKDSASECSPEILRPEARSRR